MNKLEASPRPRYRPGIGVTFAGLVSYQWAASIIKGWGYATYRSPGIFLGLGLFMGFVLAFLLADILLARIVVDRSLRSSLWLSAIIGPYASLLAFNEWGSIMASQIAGILATLLAFGLGYFLDKRIKPL